MIKNSINNKLLIPFLISNAWIISMSKHIFIWDLIFFSFLFLLPHPSFGEWLRESSQETQMMVEKEPAKGIAGERKGSASAGFRVSLTPSCINTTHLSPSLLLSQSPFLLDSWEWIWDCCRVLSQIRFPESWKEWNWRGINFCSFGSIKKYHAIISDSILSSYSWKFWACLDVS